MNIEAALAIVLRFGAAMLRSGDTAFRVRDAMGQLAKALGIEHLAVHITIGGMTATAQAGAKTVTLAQEVAPLGVDASRIAALEQLARTSKPGLTAQALLQYQRYLQLAPNDKQAAVLYKQLSLREAQARLSLRDFVAPALPQPAHLEQDARL